MEKGHQWKNASSTSSVPRRSRSRKRNKKSLPPTSMESTSPPSGGSVMTIIGYRYGPDGEVYKSKIPGKNITLKRFKSHLFYKKGNFKYFFKRVCDFGTGVVLEEVSDDSVILPLWEGKVFCVIERMDDDAANDDQKQEKGRWKFLQILDRLFRKKVSF